jgi:hypothetical protein
LDRALLTGIQRVAKESIFSDLNNVTVCTVLSESYSAYFGLDETETSTLLESCDLSLNDDVKQQYDGYQFGKTEMYNPWSIINYANSRQLEDYWVKTSTNSLVHQSIARADFDFQEDFDTLIVDGIVTVYTDLSCSFLELEETKTLWGLLINSGYLTVVERINNDKLTVRIPNGEVRKEFIELVAKRTKLTSRDLSDMFQYLLDKEMDRFMAVYRKLVLTSTSFHDAKEYAYHMLFLGMSFLLRDLYKVTSNIEAGHGRGDIIMESLVPAKRSHIIIEFKQGEDIENLKNKALRQIMDMEYYAGLKGEILCIGIAHDIKRCDYAYEVVTS